MYRMFTDSLPSSVSTLHPAASLLLIHCPRLSPHCTLQHHCCSFSALVCLRTVPCSITVAHSVPSSVSTLYPAASLLLSQCPRLSPHCILQHHCCSFSALVCLHTVPCSITVAYSVPSSVSTLYSAASLLLI
ncbi:hypothetical protein PoB_005411100 [Plakobranchus ocellatus]|uniref:Uncharacterized protein n=1 Tax=Plakobranchus ocellatus TaxID=259542 RepID=A0AAV4C4C5_9GAST|nr:hypothetical protein PoB_005411100 [Plakobranchus ocellatus]